MSLTVSIADFKVEIINPSAVLSADMKDYITDRNSEFRIEITESDYGRKKNLSLNNKGYMENYAVHRKLAECIPLHDAFVLHCACIDVDGVGVAFAAQSGTGKTTHMNLWQQFLGKRMTIVNGDKPIVRFFENDPLIPYAYGTPWNGKEKLGCNMRTSLQHLCFIERSKENFVETIDKDVSIDYIFNQVFMPHDAQAKLATITLINRLLSSCKLWKIHCNMQLEAAEMAYNKIFSRENS